MPDNPGALLSVPKSKSRCAAEVEGWLELDCPEKALTKLVPLLDTPGARPAGLCFRTQAFVSLGRYEEALADLEELRLLEPDPDWLDLTEAWCLKRVGKLESAVSCMERLVERSHKSGIGHYNLGCYLALVGRKEPAIEAVTRACGIEESFRQAAATESDLDSLRDDPRFEQLLP